MVPAKSVWLKIICEMSCVCYYFITENQNADCIHQLLFGFNMCTVLENSQGR